MVCGATQIWPMPTGRVSVSRHSLTFNANQISFDVHSAFSEAKQLLLDTYDIFLHDIKSLSNQPDNLATNTNKHDSRAENIQLAAGEPVASNTMHNCDINKVVITADIYAIADTALHMEMDESYALNVTSECWLLLWLWLWLLFSFVVCIFTELFSTEVFVFHSM